MGSEAIASNPLVEISHSATHRYWNQIMGEYFPQDGIIVDTEIEDVR